jgi:hypothetical protein
MQWLGESQCGSVHRRQDHQTPCNVSCNHTKRKHCIGWHNWKLVSQGMMLLTAFIHFGRHIILLKGIHHSLFCHMEVELGKAISSYVQDVYVFSHIFSIKLQWTSFLYIWLQVRACILSQCVFWWGNSGFPSALQTAQGGVRISFIISYVNSSACISSSCTLCKQSDTLQCKGTLVFIHGNSLFSICHWECFYILLPMLACFEKVVFIGSVWGYLAFSFSVWPP